LFRDWWEDIRVDVVLTKSDHAFKKFSKAEEVEEQWLENRRTAGQDFPLRPSAKSNFCPTVDQSPVHHLNINSPAICFDSISVRTHGPMKILSRDITSSNPISLCLCRF
jgi:hypothetical protein